ncbi:hypothetical protein MMC07_000272 [Pseudocyphellaria aurata]|nr:hypothetical protein [Pseudocyphellaria aurata]
MKVLLPQQPRLQWLCFQCRHVNIPCAPTNRGLRTSPRKLVRDGPPRPRELSSVPSMSAISQRVLENIRSKAKDTSSEPSSAPSMSSISRRVLEHNRRRVRDMSSKSVEGGRNSIEGGRKSSLATIGQLPRPHHLHVISTRHNTHITLTNANRQPIISVSSGSIGFRKAARGSYDAAYQLGSYVIGRIRQRGLLRDIHSLELIFRDFGLGRDAMQKLLLGSEGKYIRDRIVRVMDATKLKFGGETHAACGVHFILQRAEVQIMSLENYGHFKQEAHDWKCLDANGFLNPIYGTKSLDLSLDLQSSA